jgi:hypothetical protein
LINLCASEVPCGISPRPARDFSSPRQLCQRLAPRRHIGVTCGGSRTPMVGRCSHERRLIRFDGALTMKPSLALSGDVNVRHGSCRAYLAGKHGFGSIVSFNREAGVANATLASFCGHGPTFPTLDADVTVVGSVLLDPPPRFAPWLGVSRTTVPFPPFGPRAAHVMTLGSV